MNRIKNLLQSYRQATQSYCPDSVKQVLSRCFSENADLKMCYPFGDLSGSEQFQSVCLDSLYSAMPDLERRDMIVLSGETPEGQCWIGTMGNYMGTFLGPFLHIPPTGHLGKSRGPPGSAGEASKV